MKQIKLFTKGIEKLTAFVNESKVYAAESSTTIEGLEYAKNLSNDIVQLKGKSKSFTEIFDKRAELKEKLLRGEHPITANTNSANRVELKEKLLSLAKKKSAENKAKLDEILTLLQDDEVYLQKLSEIESEQNIYDLIEIFEFSKDCKFNPQTGEKIEDSAAYVLEQIKLLIAKRHVPSIKQSIIKEFGTSCDEKINNIIQALIKKAEFIQSDDYLLYNSLLSAIKSNKCLTSGQVVPRTGSYSEDFINFVSIESKEPTVKNIIKNKDSIKSFNKYSSRMEDLPIAKRVEDMVEHFKMTKDMPQLKQLNDALYENYLNLILKQYSPKTAKWLISRCEQINREFGVKVILPKDTSEAGICLKLVYQELSGMMMHSNGQAKMPPVLDFLRTKQGYVDKTAAYGRGVQAAFAEHANAAVSVDGMTIERIKRNLRHELTHTNDIKKLYEFPENFDKSKYYNEFKNAGINQEKIDYACINPREFIAVASEGDMSKYSEEFKKILVDFGMPKWMLKLQSPSKWIGTTRNQTNKKLSKQTIGELNNLKQASINVKELYELYS